MAGTDSRFNAATFRDAIHFVMEMGLPTTAGERATFRWTTQSTYATESPARRPYDWTSTPTSVVTHPDVQIPVAVEFSARPAASRETRIGEFDASAVTLTVLDEDYALIAGADLVILGGNTYEIRFVAPPTGLFDVTVYQLFCVARDES